MKTSSSTIFAVMACLSSFAAASAPAPEGYQEDQMQWKYDTPDGQEITLNGTIEQTNAEYETLYPGELAKGEKPELVARQFEKDLTVSCFKADGNPFGWERASLSKIQEGLNHLYDAPGKPVNGPGPGNCGRVSCSHDSAIWWCNDNEDKSFTLDSFQVIAVAAAEIVHTCSGGYTFTKTVGGQAFSEDNINVVVRKDDC